MAADGHGIFRCRGKRLHVVQYGGDAFGRGKRGIGVFLERHALSGMSFTRNLEKAGFIGRGGEEDKHPFAP